MEQIDLTTPLAVDPRTSTFFKVRKLVFDWEGSLIFIRLSDGSVYREFYYTGQEATDLMVLLNKANLSTNSLHKRVLNKLIADGKLTGTVNGSPD